MSKMGKARGAARHTREGLFIQRYPSISMAAEETGISAYLIKAACEGKYDDAGGFKWKYSTYGKLKPKAGPGKPEETEAQRQARIDAVLDKIRKANNKGK